MDGCPVTDWITAIATVGAAVGTVGAVIVALWQIRQQGRRSLHVECRFAIAAPTPGSTVHAIALSAANDGQRPVKIEQAYVQTDDARQVFAVFASWSDSLPKLLLDGEAVQVAWERQTLDEIKVRDDFNHYLYAFFTDTLGNVYSAPYPGVERKRQGPPWKRRTEWVPKPEDS